MRRLIHISDHAPDWFEQGRPVKDLAGENDDVHDILEPEEWDWEWRRTMVPLDVIDFTSQRVRDPERIESLKGMTDAWKPIIVALIGGRAKLLDGGHRIQIAGERGESEIDALVGRPRTSSARMS